MEVLPGTESWTLSGAGDGSANPRPTAVGAILPGWYLPGWLGTSRGGWGTSRGVLLDPFLLPSAGLRIQVALRAIFHCF